MDQWALSNAFLSKQSKKIYDTESNQTWDISKLKRLVMQLGQHKSF